MNLLKSVTTVSVITLFSRVLGFIRDVIIAQFFGAGMYTDAFFMAFKLPNLLRRIFAEGAFSQAFIPVFIEYKNRKIKENKNSHDAICLFISCIFGMLILSLIIVTIMGMTISTQLAVIIAPGFTKNEHLFTVFVYLLKVMFPYIILISLTSLISVILNSYDCFILPAFAPILFNISIIIFIMLYKSYFNPSIISLGWGVICGGIVQLIFQLPYLKKINLLVMPRIIFNNPYSLSVIRRMGPAIIGMSVSQISSIINNMFSSFLAFGSLSWLYYANRLVELPIGVLGVALSTIILPALSKSLANGNYDEYLRLMNWGLKICLLLSLPSTAGLILLSKPIIISLFQYGKFNYIDTSMTQYALITYSIGLIALMTIKVLVLGFYSNNDMKTPVKIAIITLIVTQLINFILFNSLGHICLAFSISIAAILNASLLYYNLLKKNIFKLQDGWGKFLLHIFIATLVMTLVLLIILNYINTWDHGLMPERILRLLITCMVAITVYFSVLRCFGFRLKDFYYQSNT
ncbi:murein biosynthesis integral membrane protein MurJ [Candidatus Pantoea edessiphila]|uniref:Probable lipid II flippase MurJ n=1 Tax=Candidatus Pantoea edessiphila TaxID=2044610 RepID=A0A2P5T0L6_9GAMM|nr:murein biosynthesis integral membrane protein MurJ [Candidatus Pantoea edessiphila]PPI88100.1 murein biosynthesis integral membrane protein MurJ [Candidatus Pantoea edessiphila]